MAKIENGHVGQSINSKGVMGRRDRILAKKKEQFRVMLSTVPRS